MIANYKCNQQENLEESAKMRILIVEDNELIIKALTALLNYQNYVVEVATDGQMAWDLIQAFDYDLILLDIKLPKIDGITLCKQLRAHGCQAPILLLTGQDSSNDKAAGLDAGADDYVVKPFDSRELVARIRALLRRGIPTSSPVLEWGNLRLDPNRVEVYYETQSIQLTPKEYALLELFMRYPQRVFSCDKIIEHIWSFDNSPTEEAVRTQIKGLRQKLKAAGSPPDLIETIYGTGYRLKTIQTKHSESIYPKIENKQKQKTTRNRFQDRDERPRLLIVDKDRQFTCELVKRTQMQGILADVATSLSEARDKIDLIHPNAVLLDLAIGKTIEESFTLLAELLLQKPPVPFVVFTTHNDLNVRREITQLGGRAFLQKPLPVSEVLQAILRVLQPTEIVAEAVILVADSDPQVSNALSTLLEPWGFKVSILENPQRFWETLEISAPDLLIMNLDMPNLNAIELCQVIRNNVRWGGLPILLLVDSIDAATMHKVFAAGADDFVSKPIVGPELVTRVLHRLERIKLQQNLAEIDPLTKLYNRHRATQDLNKLLRLSSRYNQSMCLAILDLDNFKQVNNTFGHGVGDTVLRQLAQLLQQSFRGEDVVSHWCGDEFVVGLYGMTRSHGLQRLLQVIETLHKQKFSATEHSEFQVTVSMGIAQYPEDGSDLQTLYQSATKILEQTKATRDSGVLPELRPKSELPST
jgi:diguanylate cyclase (GGDEF)-like protein